MTQPPMSLIEADNLTVEFHGPAGRVCAVDRVSFTLDKGECLGLVGESGSGKSVLCQALLGLVSGQQTLVTGDVVFDGVRLLSCPLGILRKIRGGRISMIFQDPMTSLNPYMRVSDQLAEPLIAHRGLTGREARNRVIAALEEVGIPDAAMRANDFPHRFSGGMRQRVMLAMALITRPEILVADEPTTALDVTVQAQILELLDRLRREHGTAVIFITHDLGIVAGFCDRMMVLYSGRVMEQGPTGAVFEQPRHPYTQALRDSIPGLQEKGRPLRTIPGMPPRPGTCRTGCLFAARCPKVRPSCRDGDFPLRSMKDTTHQTACPHCCD